MPDDIHCFSSPDNYWCFTFERAVHGYIERSSNQKNLELTFAKAENRKELLKFLFDSAVGCSLVSESMITAMDTGNVYCSLDTRLAAVHHANSLEQAKQKYSNLNITEPILVGGKSPYCFKVI